MDVLEPKDHGEAVALFRSEVVGVLTRLDLPRGELAARLQILITSQLPTKSWHEALGDPTIADAICDRLVHNAHVLALRGPSMRKKKGLGSPQPETTT